MEHIFKEIHAERLRQEAKWGQQNHHPMLWLPILGEEVGEANKAALETYFNYKSEGAEDYTDYRTELVQVAAVAIAMIESLDRGKWASQLNGFNTVLKQVSELKPVSEAVNITFNLEALHKGNLNLLQASAEPLTPVEADALLKMVTDVLLRAVKHS